MTYLTSTSHLGAAIGAAVWGLVTAGYIYCLWKPTLRSKLTWVGSSKPIGVATRAWMLASLILIVLLLSAVAIGLPVGKPIAVGILGGIVLGGFLLRIYDALG